MRHYRGFIADSARWNGVTFRPDDIVISTPSKSGTTWMQTMVAMLVLRTVELPAPMGLLSPWIDKLTQSEADIHALAAAQQHRRFLKTHTPLDGVPWDDHVTYLTVTRHPLQVFRSMEDHMANMDVERTMVMREAAVGLDDLASLRSVPPRSDDPRLRLLEFVDDDADYSSAGGTTSLFDLVHHVKTFWEQRHRPNVHLFHYDDLLADLDGQMRRLAEVLGVPIPEDWGAFVAAAGFDAMKANADKLAPDTHEAHWRSNTDFFRAGAVRQIDDLTEEDVAHFEGRLEALAGPDVAAWMLRGERG